MKMNFVRPKEEEKKYEFKLENVCIREGQPGYEAQQYKKNKYGRYDFTKYEKEKEEQSLKQKVDTLFAENKKLSQTIDSLKSEIERSNNLYSEQEFIPEAKKESIQKVIKK